MAWALPPMLLIHAPSTPFPSIPGSLTKHIPQSRSVLLRSLTTLHRAVALIAAILNAVAVDARCRVPGRLAVPCPFSSIKVDVLEIEGVDVTRYVPEEGQTNVDA